jgi:WD40 repeat protein
LINIRAQVNTIEFDPQGRYLGVGCRDKTFTVFDTSTYVVVKVFHTLCWVTSCSWALDNIVAIRSETNCVSVLDLSPIRYTNISLSSSQQRGDESSCSLSWSRTGQFLARAVGCTVAVVDSTAFDADNNFRHVATFDMSRGNVVTKVAFCQAADKADLVAAVDDRGRLVVLRLRFGSDAASSNDAILEVEKECAVEPNLKALAWSPDGSLLATGGRAKLLHVFTTNDLKRRVEPIVFGGRIWDIDFVPKKLARSSPTVSSPLMAIALGDYTTTVLDDSYEPVLQISRTLTCRCLKFHPSARVMAIGDGAGTVAVVDYDAGELLTELHAGGRVNDLDYSPGGDFLIVGTDDCRFSMYESSRYLLLQETSSNGFALSASFAPSGRYLALGSESDNYKLIRLGPFLGVDLVPLTLEGGVSDLPAWALKESLYRSGEGPSFLQRHMLRGGSDNLRRVSAILRDHPHAIYTFDRQTGEGCFDTALRLKKPGLVKLVVLSLVDGTLDPTSDKETNFLTTNIPQRVRETLADIVENYPPDYIVDIFNGMTFMKVPFTGPRVVESGDRIECGSKRYTDPWSVPHEGGRQLERSATSTKLISRGGSVRTPAILPLPGLGDMDFLASLLASAPHDVFDSDALALVLRVLWENHIRRYYYVDCCLFAVFYMSWIVLVELVTVSASESPVELNNPSASTAMVLVVVSFNTLFAAKELVESRYGKRSMYWRSLWNTCDLVSIASVYAYSTEILVTGNSMVPLAVVTTLFLTVKVLSYLRGFSATGWLLSVLTANFRDVRGFLIILCTILVGFSVAFRLLFGETGDESFGSLRRSFLSTFELTITGSYDPSLLFEARYTVVAIITFILAITCVLVVALNALISILGDSYARVQQNAVANRRRELASLVVEYMSLLPPWKRRQIEKQTRWFHTLLEVDADGSLHVQTDDWEGGLNALRRDMEELSQANKQSYEKTLEHLKADLDSDIAKFKEEVVSLLENLADDVKHLRKAQSQSIIKFDPKQNMAKVVKAVRSVGRQGGGISKSDDN